MYHIAVEDWGILLTEMAETEFGEVLRNTKNQK